MNEKPKDIKIGILKSIRLGLTFYKVVVKGFIEDRRVVAGEVLVYARLFLYFVSAGYEYDKEIGTSFGSATPSGP